MENQFENVQKALIPAMEQIKANREDRMYKKNNELSAYGIKQKRLEAIKEGLLRASGKKMTEEEKILLAETDTRRTMDRASLELAEAFVTSGKTFEDLFKKSKKEIKKAGVKTK